MINNLPSYNFDCDHQLTDLMLNEDTYKILDYLAVGICIFQEDLTVIFWNQRLEDWTRITRDKIMGTKISQHFPHFLEPKYAHRLQQIFRGGPPTIFSSQLHSAMIPARTFNGQLRIQHTTVVAIPKTNSQEYNALLVIEDVTDLTTRIQDYRKMRDQALAEINEKNYIQEALSLKTSELERRNFELIQLSEMNDLLQACLTVDEAYLVIPRYIKFLFPEVSGNLFILDDSKQSVKSVAQWGDYETSKTHFLCHECWGLRRGRLHSLHSHASPLICQHIQSVPTEFWCIPLTAQGESLGLFYLSSPEPGKLTENKKILVLTLTEHIALALANIKLRETLREKSIRDPLTGLLNRHYFEECLEQQVYRANRNQTDLGVIMLDIDHFKVFNQKYGNNAGDFVLQVLGDFLQTQINEGSMACRYRGEQFVLMLPGMDLDGLCLFSEEIRHGAKNLDLKYKNQLLDSITISLGIACFPKNGTNTEDLILATEKAMYQAKKEGRDRFAVAAESEILIKRY
jgi:diguanylate cyclase (GGDEF)-like protein/PAS domain S-box-containing protein